MVWNFQTMTSHYGSESITYQICQTAIYCAQEGPSVPFIYIHLIPLYFKFWYILIGYIMQHLYWRYPRYCCRSLGEQERINKTGFLNESALQRKLRMHIDKVIGHQGRRGKNCTRKGREENSNNKKNSKLALFCV